MASSMAVWEQQLIAQAQVAPDPQVPGMMLSVDGKRLASAYKLCDTITKEHSRTFFLASGLLPPAKKQAARALYAFCRLSDDLIDHKTEDQALKFRHWRQQMVDHNCPEEDPVVLAWMNTRARHHIPAAYVRQFLDGVERDLTAVRYQTFADLTEYCYGVAATVGLMSMHIIGFSGPEAIPYAVKLGVALQLTNILRDVNEDWTKGRLYLPLSDLQAFDLTEQDIARGQVNGRWRAFMQFQIERTRQLYTEALPGVTLLGREGRLAIAAAAELYQAILTDIEAHDYDVFSRRAYISHGTKLKLLPGIWWRTHTKAYDRLAAAQAKAPGRDLQSHTVHL
jgi:15-cis-phytoene synthase